MKNYNEATRAKILAKSKISISKTAARVDTNVHEQKILRELKQELQLSRYDLHESDVLRTLKILDILERYPEVFKYRNALKLFYVLARLEYILETTLREFCDLSKVEFNAITRAMTRHELILKNKYEEIELTLHGKSLASCIGHDFFIHERH